MTDPRFCPFCGSVDALKPTSGAGFVEKGCYLHDGYCFEGDLPGFVCSSCRRDFYLDVDDDTIHESCDCATDPDCECGRYQEAHA